jgi:hypothetical protein
MFKYTLTNKRRSDCPHCGKGGKYSAYMNTKTGELAPIEFGMCSSCQESKRPPDNYIQGESIHVNDDKLGFFEADTIDIILFNHYHKPSSYVENNFIEGLEKIFGDEKVKTVYNQYKLGRFYDNGIIFPYFYTDNHLCTAKIMWYDDNLNRIHEGKKAYPKYFHNLIYTIEKGWGHIDYNNYDIDDDCNDIIIPFKLKLCLFGHHLVINDKQKIICLVESEKTAVIMSIVLPEYIWVACAGKNMIQDYKFLFFTGRKCLAFPDLSEDDNVYQYWFEKLTYYNRKYGYDFEIVDYYSDFLQNDNELIKYCKCEGKFDIADFVLHFNTNNVYTDFINNKLKITLNKASTEAQILIPEIETIHH